MSLFDHIRALPSLHTGTLADLGPIPVREHVVEQLRRRIARAAVAPDEVQRLRAQWRRVIGWSPSAVYLAQRLARRALDDAALPDDSKTGGAA